MAQLLIWGKAREIVSGEALAGPSTEEVETLAALEASLDGAGPALVLADPSRLEAEREATEAWFRTEGVARALLVAVADAADGDDILRRFPFVDDVLTRPVTPTRLRTKIERALETIHNRRVIRQLEDDLRHLKGDLTRKREDLSKLNEIGIALSAERDIQKLLDLILSKSREITGADAGSLYLVERANGKELANGLDQIRFKLAQNDSVDVPFREFTMPLDHSSIAGHVALSGEPVNVQDAYHLPEGSIYQISRSFDERSGYRSKSMLVVPMKDHENVVVGVVQLINKKRHWQAVLKSTAVVDEEVIPFTPADEGLAGSLASQAAVAFENAKLLQDIRDLFDSFVHASVKAIEQRDPPTSGHSERVAILTVALAERVNSISLGRLAQVSLSTDQLRELEYAALLHDFGKVGVQEKYLRKKKKLFAGEMIKIRQRFAYILKSIETDYLRAQLDLFGSSRDSVEARAALDAEYQRRRADAERLLKAVIRANEPKVVADAFTVESVSAFLEGPGRLFMGNEEEDLFPVEDWAAPPFLSCAEVEALSIPRGSLTHREKEKINEHVSISYEFLTKIPWTGEFKDIPRIAYAHHEKLDGSGYPRRLTATEIPIQSRMMTISDIYDALVAQDRPYKKAEPPERALGILEDEQRRGQLDGDLLRVFIEAKIYDLQTFKDLIKRRT